MTEKPIQHVPPSQLISLIKDKISTKEESSKIAGAHGAKIKSAVENAGLDKKAFNVAAGLYKLFDSNELKARAHLDALQNYLEVVRSEFMEKGHAGNLDDMAKGKVDAKDAVAGVKEPEKQDEPASNVTPMQMLEAKRAGRRKVKVEAAAAPVSAPATLDDDLPAPPQPDADQIADEFASGPAPEMAPPPPPPAPTYALS